MLKDLAKAPIRTWVNPKGIAAVQESWGPRGWQPEWAMDVWDCICEVDSGNNCFRRRDVQEALQLRYPNMKSRTAEKLVGAVFIYAIAVPEDFYGPNSRLTQVSRGLYTLKDGKPLE